jgi:multiple sugar transport system substrate-binding protein
MAAGQHTAEAAQFVAFLTSKEPMAEYSAFFPPIRESLLTPEVLVGSSQVLTPELVQPIIDGVKSNGKVFPVAADNSAVATALNSALDEYLYQPGVDVAQALGSVCAEIAPLLK